MKQFFYNSKKLLAIVGVIVVISPLVIFNIVQYKNYKHIEGENSKNISKNKVIAEDLKNAEKQFSDLKKEDQYKINQMLAKRIADIEDAYKATLTTYEAIQDLRSQKQNVDDLEKGFALVLSVLADVNYPSASASLKTLSKNIDTMKQKMNETTSFASSY